MLTVRVLGGFELEVGGARHPAPAGRCGTLLAWLALHPGMHTRARVAARLWPDVLDESARRSLRTALLDLRKALAPDVGRYVIATRDEIGLGPPEELWVDAHHPSPADEELLPGFDHDWVHAAREAHRVLVQELIERLAVAAEGAGDHATALSHTRRLVTLDPLSEEHARALIRRLAAAGDRAAALTAYDRHRDRLRDELRVVPSPATRALVDEIRAGAPSSRPRPPSVLPAALTLAADGRPIVGRDEEIEGLLAAWEAAADDTLRLQLVTGEPGIGKSRLVAELAQRVAHAGGHVLYGACYEDPRPPYAPFLDAVERDLRSLDDDTALERLGPQAAQIARVVPEVGERFGVAAPAPGDSPEGDQQRLFAAIGAYLQRCGRGLLVIEDLHWATTATFALLAHVMREGRGALLIAVTSRDVAPDVTPELSAFMADLVRLPGTQRRVLDGLRAEHVAELLRVERGERLDLSATADALHEATRGSPLFLRELIRDLPGDGAGSGLPLSVSLRDLVAQRFARLPEAEAEMLDCAAVLGAEFEAGVVAAVLDRPVDVVLDALDRAVKLGVVAMVPERDGRFAFTHAVLREVRYDGIPAGRRVRFHHAAGQALRRTGGASLADLARHFCAGAALGDVDAAFAYARQAGELARERFAFADAAEQLERAERMGALLPDLAERTRAELAIQRGEALHRAGDARHREVLLGGAVIARRLEDPELLARCALALSEQGWTISAGTSDHDVLAVSRDALAAMPAERLADRARLLSMIAAATHLTDRHEEARSLALEGLALARESDDQTAVGEALITTHWACFDPERIEQRLDWAEEARTLGEDARNPVLLSQALRMLGQDRLELADLPGARVVLRRAHQIAEQLDVAYLRLYGPALAAILAALEGRLVEAQRLLGESIALGRRIGIDGPAFFGGVGGAVLIEAGLWEQAAERLAGLVERTRGITAYRASLAMFCARLGRNAEARSHLDAFVSSDFAILPRNIQWTSGMVMLADAATRLGDAHAATRLREQLDPVAGRTAWHAFTALWPVDLALAQLCLVVGDHDAAAAHLQAASDLCERCDLPHHRVRVALHRALLLLACGQEAEATPIANAAVAAAGRLQGQGVLREAGLMGFGRGA